MKTDLIFTEISEPQELFGGWYVMLGHHHNSDVLPIKIDEAYVQLVSIADCTNENYVQVNLKDLVIYTKMGELTLHIVRYELESCYVMFEFYINGQIFSKTCVEQWRAIAFAKAYNLHIHCTEEIWYEMMDHALQASVENYCYPSLLKGLELIGPEAIYTNQKDPDKKRALHYAQRMESAFMREIAKRHKQFLGDVIGSLVRSKQNVGNLLAALVAGQPTGKF